MQVVGCWVGVRELRGQGLREKVSQGIAVIRPRGGPAALGPSLLPARSGDGQEPAAAPYHQRLSEQRQPRGARHGPARGLRTRATHSALPAGAG